jgi:hypothetical protein
MINNRLPKSRQAFLFPDTTLQNRRDPGHESFCLMLGSALMSTHFTLETMRLPVLVAQDRDAVSSLDGQGRPDESRDALE